jgi:hypothetical protein
MDKHKPSSGSLYRDSRTNALIESDRDKFRKWKESRLNKNKIQSLEERIDKLERLLIQHGILK